MAIGRRVIMPPPIPILMQDAAALIADLLGTGHYAVAEMSADCSTLTATLTIQSPDSAAPEQFSCKVPADGTQSLAGYALRSAHPVAVGELIEDERFDDAFLKKHRIISALAVPLMMDGQSFGALIACSHQAQSFEREDLLFSETVAHLVGTAIAKRRAEAELEYERHLHDDVPAESEVSGQVGPRRSEHAGSPGVEVSQNRRVCPRRAYPYRQSIAPIINGALPPKGDFKEVHCRDIAAGGFSYVADAPPASNSLIVALGQAPNFTYVAAEIVHVNRVNRDGRHHYVVGCVYTGRANY